MLFEDNEGCLFVTPHYNDHGGVLLNPVTALLSFPARFRIFGPTVTAPMKLSDAQLEERVCPRNFTASTLREALQPSPTLLLFVRHFG